MSVVESNRGYGGRSVSQRRVQRRARFADAALSVFAENWGQWLADLARAAAVAQVPLGGWRRATTVFIGAVDATVHQWSLDDPRPSIADPVDVLTTILRALMARTPGASR
ncbi:hypothetical protein ACFQZZ_14785 [Nocardia sp. GCM10030253]|uniref:hypothetical protein n=1 Tax=Nocardia sp. GCM10030253 TaxID=3273404 RepID=UPI00363126B7